MKNRLILLSFLAALSVWACSEKETNADPVKLVAQPATLWFPATGGTQEIVLTSGIKPDISSSDSWISLSEGAYASNTLTLGVTARENSGTEGRSGSIRVIGDKQSLMITVRQGVPEVKMSVSQDNFSFNQFGGEAVFTVVSSQQPSATSNVDWCGLKVGTISASHETTVTLQVAANRIEERHGSVTVRCGSEELTVSLKEDGCSIPMASTVALDPQAVFEALAPGWNMGNQMDAISNGVASETVWGNEKCTQATMDGVKAAGFKAVRICTTWEGHIGPEPAHLLDEKWLSRVEEIVGYAEKAGLVAIVNTHHDESYWQDISKAYNNRSQNAKVENEIFCVWTQIANRFKDKGEWLIFESFNEIQDGGWGWSTAFREDPKKQYDVLNGWNQVFVDAVRATGGNNATRWLGIPGYAASPGFTIDGLVLPSDATDANRLMVAVHDYDPYDYTLRQDPPMLRRFGHTAEATLRPSGDNEAGLRSTFDQLKSAYIDKGIPVYLGEFGCSRHAAEDMPFQKYYMEYFCKAAADRLLPMFLWDNGASGVGPERHGYINHGSGKLVDDTAKELVEIIVKAATTKDAAYTLESVYDSAP